MKLPKNIFNQTNNHSTLKKEIDKYRRLNKILVLRIKELEKNPQNQKSINLYIENWLTKSEQSFIDEFNKKLSNAKNEYQIKANQLLLECFERINIDSYKEDFLFKTKCKNLEIKSRLIGLNGRNKKSFEKVAGTELIINQNNDEIMISCPNLIKKELAKKLLLRLLDIKNIEPNKIINYYKEEQVKFTKELIDLGKNIIEDKLKLNDINPNIYEYIGRMKYRNSYGQNLLEHSLECAFLAEQLANELNLDPSLAKQCAFFHDIGKTIDFESGKNHVELGVSLAINNNLNSTIIHSIEAHHGEVYCKDEYAVLTKIVDKASASRFGARNDSIDNFYKRVKMYEEICYQFPEVKDCWVLSTGFLIKIIIKPNMVKDDELSILGYKIKNAFETNPNTSSYNISLELIKENVFKIKTKKTIN